MHDCKHECKHKSVKFCGLCNKVYCENCKWEWENTCTRPHYNVWYTPTTPVYPGYEIWSGNNANVDLQAITETVTHKH